MPRSQAASGLAMTYGARVIDSTPPPMNTSPSPTAIAWAAELIAWSPLPHSRLTVSPPTSTGSPARSSAIRATSRLSSPAWFAQPRMTSSIERRVDPGAIDDGPQHGGGEVVRPDGGEGAAVAADRRADGLDDPGIAQRTMQVSGHARIVGGLEPATARVPLRASGAGRGRSREGRGRRRRRGRSCPRWRRRRSSLPPGGSSRRASSAGGRRSSRSSRRSGRA